MDLSNITLVKVNRAEINYHTCLIPFSEKDIETYKNIAVGQKINCKIKSDRKYSTHKYLFKMIDFAVENHISEKDCFIHNTDFVLRREVIQAKLIENNMDYVRTWLDILEILFLPFAEKTSITGEKIKVKASIKYSKLDELKFKEFENKVALFFSDNLEMTLDKFKIEVNKY